MHSIPARNSSPTLALLAALAATASLIPAQEPDDLPTERVEIIPPGGLVDLDSGAVLPVAKLRVFEADLRFDRDGAGFFLQALRGAQPAMTGDASPDPDSWSTERVRITRRDSNSLLLFVKTDRGVARVSLAVSDPYSTASAVLRWVVVPPADPVFLPPPTGLETHWQDDKLHVSWDGVASRWLVEVSGERVDKHMVQGRSIALEGLDPKGNYRIRVRGLIGAAVSLPADVVQHGPRRPAVRQVTEFPGRWYDATGGLRLSTGEVAVEDAEVVFYLYGVYVPGGGVLKLGAGEGVYRATHALPPGPYPPSYGRLDERDVLAIELPDGRCGKLWLEPMDGDDLRSGMRVHSVFLPDGRRIMQPPITEAKSSVENGAVVLRWQAAADAENYRVAVNGGAPIVTQETTARLAGLPRDALHSIDVSAVSRGGDVSEPVTIHVHTFGPDAVHGTAVLEAQNGGIVFRTGAMVPNGQPCDLAFVSSAGGAASVSFEGAAGVQPAAAFAFGDFTGIGEPGKVTRVHSDVRDPKSEHFYVHTADGGRASVRILQRGSPRTKIEFLWLPKAR